MGHSFIAYIDESGDDGLNPAKFRQIGRKGGSSHWLVVSATVMRYSWHTHTVGWRDHILKVTRKQTRHLHFAGLNHGQRVATAQFLAKRPIRGISILSNKSSIAAGTFATTNQYYWYLARYLIERLSWLCRDNHRVGDGDGTVKIVFSRRGGMSYEDFRSYLRHLRAHGETSIHWPSIDIESVDARDHSRSAALQLSDSVASGMGAALELDEFGNCECRYAECLKRITYHRANNYLSYGVKIVPVHNNLQLTEDQLKFVHLFA